MTSETIILDGLEFTLQRKPRQKNTYLKVDRRTGEVTVSAPQRIPKRFALQFVRQNMSYIKEKQRLVHMKNAKRPKLQSGESIPLWGEPVNLKVTTQKKSSLCLKNDVLEVALSEPSEATLSKALKAWYKDQVAKVLDDVVWDIEKRTGLHATSFQIRYMKTRWGSCTISTKRIRINSKLAMFPPLCLEYVVLHELAHLFETGHNRRFYHFIEEYMPNWREAKECLKTFPALDLEV